MIENPSAERYVKTVSANPEMSHSKLLRRIRAGSSVLEFGPASGAMTAVMHGTLNCRVSIIELDPACYAHAMQFAQDGICADIESPAWEEHFAGQRFDYAVLADVLEHLRRPQDVLKRLGRFLKPDGAVLVSVPNIAHNSVILQLLNNQFVYQSTGILDCTHLHLFTFSELQKLCAAAGYSAVYLDAVYIGVGRNEFSEQYGDTDPAVAEYLKKRPFGEVYQHLAELRLADYVQRSGLKLDNRLGGPAAYTDTTVRTLAGPAPTDARRELMSMLCEAPNAFFETNNEIARVRLELNDLYRADEAVSQGLAAVQRLDALQAEVSEKNRYARALQQELDRREARILELQEGETARNAHIARLDAQLQRLSDALDESRRAEAHLREELAHARAIQQEQQDANDALTAERGQLLQEIRNREGHIDLLLESDRELERYKSTSAYRSFIRRQQLVDAVLPPNSKRLFILHVLKKMLTDPGLMSHVIRPADLANYIRYLSSDSIEEITRRYDEIVSAARQDAKGTLPDAAVPDEPAQRPIEAYPLLCFDVPEHPVVSILIPVYNQFEYTYECLRSILKNSGTVPYEILIADDCSTDATAQMEQVVKNVRRITTAHNVRFLLNCKNAAQHAQGEYLLFLNNDTQVRPDWLHPLVETMERYPDAGIVGSKLLYPDGRLQEAGGIVWKDASAWNYGHLKNPDDPEFCYLKEADYVSGASMMIRAALWREIGGFDERFVPAYYEDTDLAFEVRRRGYRVLMQPRSLVVHFEGVSNGTDTSAGLKAYQVENCRRFREKWKDVLEKEHFANGENVYLAKDRGQKRRQILVVDHYVPNYDRDAGGRCTYMYLKLFLKMGMKVTFIGDNFARPEPYTSELNAMGVEVLYGNYYYNNCKSWLKENLKYFDVVYLQRPHISIKYIDLVKSHAHGKIFYFAHDLHHVRMLRDYELTGDEKALAESRRWKKIEMELFEKADVCHVVGSYEQSVMQKLFPGKPIRNIPLYLYENLLDRVEKDFRRRRDLLFVGGFGHAPNVDAVTWFAREVYPAVLARHPELVWHIVGSRAPEAVQQLAGPNVVLEGFVSDEALAALYGRCRMAVVPLRYGAGVKGKVVEAAYYQIPLVTTPIGGEGLDAEAGCFVMRQGARAMADEICRLYDDFDRLRAMSDAGVQFIAHNFTPEVAEAVLRLDL